MTFADIDGGQVIINSGPYGPKDGYFGRHGGTRIPLDIATMDAILHALDHAGFPTYDSNELG